MDSARGTTPPSGAHATSDGLSHAAIYDVESSDPRSTLIDRTGCLPKTCGRSRG
ncbi:hypothetical protein [Microbacterium sp. Se5.02b]|uniref:hypothetical protein n=1 Tax=Microbacterium sp. Se5.02b TaxID=2864103 RepID=UPI002867C8BF|nr:hypothetical protein [Microbacterium sp. Se5.02b]